MKKFLLIGVLSMLLGSFTRANAVEVTINPAEGNVYGTICEIEITFPDDYNISFIGASSRLFPSISGPETASMWYSGYSFSGNVMKFKLGSVGVSLPGDYVLTVPAGCYDVAGGTSEELKFYYTIVATDQVKEYKLTPDAGEQSSLGSLVVTFPYVATLEMVDTDGIQLTGPNGACEIYTEVNSNYLVVVPQNGSTDADGEYQFQVAAGALKLMEGFVNDQIEATYNVTHLKGESVTFSPGAGQYHSLQHFEVTFIDLTGVKAAFTSDAHPYLENNETGTVAAEASSANATSSDNILSFNLDEEVTEIGSYTLVIPGDCYTVDGEPGTTLTASYQVVKNTDAYYWEASPEDGSTVSELSKVNFTFPNATSISKTSTASVSVTDSADKSYNATMTVTQNVVIVKITETLAKGVYTINIPTESLTIIDSNGDSYTNRTISVTYTIDSETSLESIRDVKATDDNTIYDLNGRRVNGQPGSGVYIINGHKTLITQ